MQFPPQYSRLLIGILLGFVLGTALYQSQRRDMWYKGQIIGQIAIECNQVVRVPIGTPCPSAAPHDTGIPHTDGTRDCTGDGLSCTTGCTLDVTGTCQGGSCICASTSPSSESNSSSTSSTSVCFTCACCTSPSQPGCSLCFPSSSSSSQNFCCNQTTYQCFESSSSSSSSSTSSSSSSRSSSSSSSSSASINVCKQVGEACNNINTCCNSQCINGNCECSDIGNQCQTQRDCCEQFGDEGEVSFPECVQGLYCQLKSCAAFFTPCGSECCDDKSQICNLGADNNYHCENKASSSSVTTASSISNTSKGSSVSTGSQASTTSTGSSSSNNYCESQGKISCGTTPNNTPYCCNPGQKCPPFDGQQGTCECVSDSEMMCGAACCPITQGCYSCYNTTTNSIIPQCGPCSSSTSSSSCALTGTPCTFNKANNCCNGCEFARGVCY